MSESQTMIAMSTLRSLLCDVARGRGLKAGGARGASGVKIMCPVCHPDQPDQLQYGAGMRWWSDVLTDECQGFLLVEFPEPTRRKPREGGILGASIEVEGVVGSLVVSACCHDEMEAFYLDGEGPWDWRAALAARIEQAVASSDRAVWVYDEEEALRAREAVLAKAREEEEFVQAAVALSPPERVMAVADVLRAAGCRDVQIDQARVSWPCNHLHDGTGEKGEEREGEWLRLVVIVGEDGRTRQAGRSCSMPHPPEVVTVPSVADVLAEYRRVGALDEAGRARFRRRAESTSAGRVARQGGTSARPSRVAAVPKEPKPVMTDEAVLSWYVEHGIDLDSGGTKALWAKVLAVEPDPSKRPPRHVLERLKRERSTPPGSGAPSS